MELGYTIIYAPGVTAAVEFYERAFTLKRRFVHESGQYAEMETGNTALGFAAEAFAEANGIAIRPNTSRDVAAGIEISFVTGTPEAAYRHAVASGAAPVRSVEMKPWEQKVSYVRDFNGCLLKIGSSVTGRWAWRRGQKPSRPFWRRRPAPVPWQRVGCSANTRFTPMASLSASSAMTSFSSSRRQQDALSSARSMKFRPMRVRSPAS